MKHNDQVRTSCDNDSNFNSKSGEGEPSTLTENSDNFDEATAKNSMSSSALNCNPSEALKTTTEGKNSNSDPDKTSVTGLDQVEDSAEQFMLARYSDSSAPSQEGFQSQINKEKRISMWHMIHQHMVSGLAAEPELKPLNRADEEKQVEDINRLPAATITDTTESDSNMGVKIHDTINQDIELRKVFAIKLVREAIEKILLPEVPDQSSDDQSVISDTISEQDHSESNSYEECAEDSQRECDKRKKEDIAAADTKELGHADNKVKSETKLENKSDKKAPKHWSNLKKWILLQRFIKALEKVKQFNPKKPRHLELEPDPDAEKVSLRHQTVEERKRAEEWMLDYALRQAVTQLAPAQKKKVALLVNAFETVKSPQENSGVHLKFPKLKEASDKSRCTTKIIDESFSQLENKTKEAKEIFASRPDYQERNSITDNEPTTPNVPMVGDSQLVNSICLKPDDIMNTSPEKLPGDENPKQDTWEETISNLKTNEPKESISKIEECQDLSRGLAVSTEIISLVSKDISSKDPITSREEMKKQANIELDAVYGKAHELSVDSKLITQAGEVRSITTKSVVCSTSYTDTIVQQQTAEKEKHRGSRPEAVVLKGFMDSKANDSDNEEDKKNYIRMWHTVYQHVISSIADKVGSKLLEGTDDEDAEDDNELHEFSKQNQNPGDDNSSTPCKGGFSKSHAIKLVQEAVDEILLPEIQDDSSETQSVTSDIVQDQEISEKNQNEGGEQNTLNSPEQIKDDLREKGSRVDNINSQESKKAEPLVHNKSELPKPKSWSKLKKLILLKRSIRALETARRLKSHPRKDLPLVADPEPEKVDLRPQILDERNKAEQWMLDYTVQHIVNKLTPARKRRVAMLVEAFEAVVPLPEM